MNCYYLYLICLQLPVLGVRLLPLDPLKVHRQINALDGRTKANSNLAGSKDAVDATVAASVVVGTAAVALVLAHQAAASVAHTGIVQQLHLIHQLK